MSEFPEAPNGYQFGIVAGKRLPHLVACEPWNTTALCGVRVYGDSLTEYNSYGRVCPKCTRAAKATRPA